MTDSGSQSDETTSGTASTGCGADLDGREDSVSKYRRKREKRVGGGDKSEHGSKLSSQRKKKGVLNAKERNIRRLESNERERKRMHDLNNQFQVRGDLVWPYIVVASLICALIYFSRCGR